MIVRTKRIYETPAPEDGTRVLIDGLWPRGMKKDAAQIHRWLREIATSRELRGWFGHRADRWDDFQRRYRAELAEKPEAVAELKRLAAGGTLTLLYAARDEAHNHAIALKAYLEEDAGAA